QDCRKQVAPFEPTGKPNGAPADIRVGMAGQIMQARSRIDAVMPERRQPKATLRRISGVQPFGHERPQFFTRCARDCGGQARQAGLTEARRGVDRNRYQISIAPMQCQRAKCEKLARLGIVCETGPGRIPAGLAGSHEPFDVRVETLVDAADVRLLENRTIDFAAAAKPEESGIFGMLIHDGGDGRDGVHRQYLN
ncbi:hypothetical protein, partial [Mesorhizobium ciceri]|uniref:hypothetical protein n=1 Tax=Mesorhizobium ciceri TaxID=39645 RepID=UPI003450E096